MLFEYIVGQPHEGSSYAAQKDEQMALHRLEHTRTRLKELESQQHNMSTNDHMINRPASDTLLSRSTSQHRTLSQNIGAMKKPMSHMDQR